jgi:antitoxin component YwqK of YwqJK toxin-antitoxin module
MENKTADLPRVDGDDLEWEGQLQTWNGAPFNGIEEWRYANGALESETAYKDGLSDGLARTWDEHGQLRSQFSCRLGAMHGNCKKWHANGQLAEDGTYEWGVRVDEKTYDEAGRLISEFKIDPNYPNSQYPLLLKFREAYGKHLHD